MDGLRQKRVMRIYIKGKIDHLQDVLDSNDCQERLPQSR